MRHKKKIMVIGGRNCTVLTEPGQGSGTLLIQPTDSHDREELDKEMEYIEAHSRQPFTLVAVHVGKWFDELAPWQAPPVFGKTPFGDGAPEMLRYITDTLIPHFSGDKPMTLQSVVIGGYSLAGLFALWAGCQCPFGAIVAASPSVWYNGWVDYQRQHPSLASRVYLSLGDRETHTKTKIMAKVGDCLNEERDLLAAQGIAVTLEMNPGNHFQDNGVRMGKGFAAVLS